MVAAAKQVRSGMFSYLWAEAGAQPEPARDGPGQCAGGLDPFVPALIAVRLDPLGHVLSDLVGCSEHPGVLPVQTPDRFHLQRPAAGAAGCRFFKQAVAFCATPSNTSGDVVPLLDQLSLQLPPVIDPVLSVRPLAARSK